MARENDRTIWILVARRTGAQIFRSHGRGLPLLVVESIDHPEGRLRSGEVNTDRAGSAHDRKGHFSHAMSTEEDATEHLDHQFARKLADVLDQGRLRGEFGQLVLVAPPKLLGQLRAALNDPTRKLLVAGLDKDLVEPSEQELRAQLAEQILV